MVTSTGPRGEGEAGKGIAATWTITRHTRECTVVI